MHKFCMNVYDLGFSPVLSIYVCLPTCLFARLSHYLYNYIYLSFCTDPTIHLSEYLSVDLSMYLNISVFLAGKFNGWVEKLPMQGKPLLSNVSAIEAFYDVFGDMTAVGASLDLSDSGVKFCGEFTPKSGNQ